MSTADAAWEDMAREGQRQDEQVAKLLRRSMATSGRSAATAKTKPKPSHSVSLPVGMSIAAPPSRPTIEQPAETVSFNLQREINRLASDQQTARKQAALALESHFLARDQAAPVDPDVFAELAKPLFRRFNDRVEKVREMAVRLATRGLAHEQDLLRYLPYLMPALSSRLDRGYALDEANQVFSRDTFLHDAFKRGRVFVDARDVQRQRPDEPSEELRLLMLELVDAVLQNAFNRNAASILHAYIFDVVLLLVASAHDDFHEVNVAACRLLAKLSNNMVSVIKHVSVALVRSLMPLLAHRLARVRVAAIEAIDALVTCPDTSKCKGSGSDAIVDLLGYRDENVIPISAFYSVEVRINYFAKLDQDGNPSVRATFFAMVGDWMLHLPDWYDHESRLLPYLLSAVSDTHDEIAQRALDTLRQLGDRYERDHGEDVLEIKQYGVDGKNPTYNYAAPLPAPFAASGRPSLGTRLLIRGRAKRFLGPILRELGSWQAATRQHAVLLLKCVLVYCEESLTAELHLLLATLLRTWRQDAELQGELETVAELVGRFSAPDTYMPLLLARVRGDEDVAAEGGGGGAPAVHTATGLELLSCLMRGSLDRSLLPHVPDVLAALTQSHVTEFESPSVKLTLAELVLQITQLLDRRGRDAISAFFLQHGRLPAMDQVYAWVFELANLLAGSGYAGDRVVSAATATLDLLAKTEAHSDVAALYAAHFSPCLESAGLELLAMLGTQWTPHCAPQLAWEQLLRSTETELLLREPNGDTLCRVFEFALQEPVNEEGDIQLAKSAVEVENRRSRYKRVLSGLLDRLCLLPECQKGSASASRLIALAGAAIA